MVISSPFSTSSDSRRCTTLGCRVSFKRFAPLRAVSMRTPVALEVPTNLNTEHADPSSLIVPRWCVQPPNDLAYASPMSAQSCGPLAPNRLPKLPNMDIARARGGPLPNARAPRRKRSGTRGAARPRCVRVLGQAAGLDHANKLTGRTDAVRP